MYGWHDETRRAGTISPCIGVLSPLPVFKNLLLAQKRRTEATTRAKNENLTTSAHLEFKKALRSQPSPGTHYHCKPVDSVQVYKEKNKQWYGSVTKLLLRDKEITAIEGTTRTSYSISQMLCHNFSPWPGPNMPPIWTTKICPKVCSRSILIWSGPSIRPS